MSAPNPCTVRKRKRTHGWGERTHGRKKRTRRTARKTTKTRARGSLLYEKYVYAKGERRRRGRIRKHTPRGVQRTLKTAPLSLGYVPNVQIVRAGTRTTPARTRRGISHTTVSSPSA